jgi:hypothetical protein
MAGGVALAAGCLPTKHEPKFKFKLQYLEENGGEGKYTKMPHDK